jgi:RNA polymerase sigma-54 factor
MKPRQTMELRQTQRLALTVGLRQSIALLRLSSADLVAFLEERAAENPFLDLGRPVEQATDWLPHWTAVFGQISGKGQGEADLQAAAPGPSLMAHVLAQIDQTFADATDHAIAMVFAEALEPSGWLGRDPADIAAEASVAPVRAEAVLARLQRFDPTGIFARSLADCLRIQAAEADRLDPVMACILDHLDLLAAGNLPRLARLAGVDPAEIAVRLRVIRGFDPKPGARFEPGAIAAIPDLVLQSTPQGWAVTLNRSALPQVSLRRGSASAMTDAERQAMASAREVVRMVEQRNATLLRVAQDILQYQRAALDHGMARLAPLTMADVATRLDLHETTISRVLAGVVVATPRGTLPLRAFICGAVGTVAAGAVRAALALMVAGEDRANPLTDADLAARLAQDGMPLARRTVAKYRMMLRIPSSAARRRPGGRRR